MIREAVQDDCQNLAALSIQVWLHTYATEGIRKEISGYVLKTFTEQYFIDLLSTKDHRILVYVERDHLLGFTVLNLDSIFQSSSNGFEICTFYVQEHFHGKGIGKKMFEGIRDRFGDNFWLSAWVYNSKAIDFYKKLGFCDIGSVNFRLGDELHENRVLSYGLAD